MLSVPGADFFEAKAIGITPNGATTAAGELKHLSMHPALPPHWLGVCLSQGFPSGQQSEGAAMSDALRGIA